MDERAYQGPSVATVDLLQSWRDAEATSDRLLHTISLPIIEPTRPTNRRSKRLRQKEARRARKRGMCELLWSTYRRQRLAHCAALERATLYGDDTSGRGLLGHMFENDDALLPFQRAWVYNGTDDRRA